MKQIADAQAGVEKNIETAKEKLKEVLEAAKRELCDRHTRYGDDRVGQNDSRSEKILVGGEYKDSVSPLELFDEAVSRCSQTSHDSEEMYKKLKSMIRDKPSDATYASCGTSSGPAPAPPQCTDELIEQIWSYCFAELDATNEPNQRRRTKTQNEAG